MFCEFAYLRFVNTLAYMVYSLSTECMRFPNHHCLTFVHCGLAARRPEQLHTPQKTSLGVCHACSMCLVCVRA